MWGAIWLSDVYGRGRVAAADILDKPWSYEEEEPAPAPLWGADMRPKVRVSQRAQLIGSFPIGKPWAGLRW